VGQCSCLQGSLKTLCVSFLPCVVTAGLSAGAVASTVVKQKLAEVILKKQQAALERTSNPNPAAMPYR